MPESMRGGQCFHFDAEWKHDASKLLRALHSILSKSIRVESAKIVSDDFHADTPRVENATATATISADANPMEDRYLWDCRSVPLDMDAMQEAASRLIGTHDFTAFGASHGKDNDPNPVKTVRRLDLQKSGNSIRLVTEGVATSIEWFGVLPVVFTL